MRLVDADSLIQSMLDCDDNDIGLALAHKSGLDEYTDDTVIIEFWNRCKQAFANFIETEPTFKRRKKMRVFISQPMLNKTNEQIEKERNQIITDLKKEYGDIEVIDSFFKDAPHDARPLWFLGKSLELLSTADLAVFAPGWSEARGCNIEHECAEKYGIKVSDDYNY